jgi:hypothetical protein
MAQRSAEIVRGERKFPIFNLRPEGNFDPGDNFNPEDKFNPYNI